MAGFHKVPYSTILDAKAGDSEAMEAVLRFFEPSVCRWSRRPCYDGSGNLRMEINQDVRDRVRAKIMEVLIYQYDPYKLPENETIAK